MKEVIPDVVGKKNNFRSVFDLIDEAMPALIDSFPELHDEKRMRSWLAEFAKRVLWEAEWAMKTGAEKGIEQSRRLLIDPEYYQHKKESRTRSLRNDAVKNSEKKIREQKEKAIADVLGETQMEANARRLRLAKQIETYENLAQMYKEELNRLPDAKHLSKDPGTIQ